ncbi:HupE/UreJ family protein [Novosphingobium album (ex Hu et al. 2023)]|uniref:HupE/UreJ family protein n=1 Tax=Novosphingobium album (ex Hu et al. 2023) TaxID=2930093 RepID=A0ABT0B660_9SPHN|nr:HupE/UreJ family protein [Novosphingobium album (ex Hu et al. 2023)]MCJ2180535.1 HupE/UreJ family protein [Novosphingobium album (ex Hu et al. 2023)]
MPDSMVSVRMHEGRWRLHLALPFDRLAMALISTGRIPDPGPGFTQYPVPDKRVVARYVLDELHLASRDGQPWRLSVVSLAPPAPNARNWSIDVDAVAPTGADLRKAVLSYDVIIRDVIPDVAVIAVDQDWQGGVLPGQPRLLGKLSEDDRTITIDGAHGTGLAALGQMVGMGVWHILEGADHIAFLLTLLLTVTLAARQGHWIIERRPRKILSNTLWRVSAFTAGHTLSLLATSLRWLPAAGQGIEVLIAISVAVTALHALTPIVPRREAWVAGGFGLIHGMAFATAIRDLDLSTGQTVAATLGFNLGIELVQLGIVAVVLPLLLWLRTRTFEPMVRRPVAAAALIMAVWWAVSRMLGE